MDMKPELYLEDFEVGDAFEFGNHTFTADGIVSFAEQYNPQRPHLGHERAAETAFGELVASGLHTFCVCCRLSVDALFARTAVVAGAGFDRVRFLEPVRPGDVLTGRATVERVEPADDHPGGYVDVEIVGTNQDGDVVLSCLDLALVESR